MNIAASGLLVLSLAFRCQADEVDKQLAKYDKIKNLHEYGDFYRTLFAACNGDKLAALVSNKNDSIATHSAWETVTLTVPEKEGAKVFRPDRNRLNWFVGFFEGRNRISVPEWWRTVVVDARANRRNNNNIYPGDPKQKPYRDVTPSILVRCPKNASVTEKDRVVTYTIGKNSIVIPEELLDRADSGELWCNISCAFTDGKCFVAIHDDVGYSHVVACIDRKTKNINWNSKACGCWWGSASGVHESWVALVPTDDGRLYCFGSASIGLYAHGFDTSNGKTLLRFSTNY